MADSKNKKSAQLCCRLKASKNPISKTLGEIVCGHADVCEIEMYKCPVCGRTTTKQESCHGKAMELVKEDKYV